ncbi:MAG: aldehyde dehydrogenase family protein, partial [Chloroflexi bacterium]
MAVAAPAREKMFIGGEWVESADGRTFDVETPAKRGQVIAQVPRGGAADVDRAVKAAQAAFPAWRAMPPRERGRLLLRIADAVDAETEELAKLLARETGNAIRTQSRPEAQRVSDLFRYFGGLGGELKGETIPLGEDWFSYTRREPLGVVAAIVPWNVPILIAAWKLAPALVAGNTVVLKPSANAPLATLAFARIAQRHLPKGVLNVITGTGDEVGTPLAEHPGIAKISFTGNTETGKAILRLAADRIIPVTLELGGKSPQILFADADGDKTADGVIDAMRFARQGQSCTAGSRLFVHNSVFDSFMDRLATKLRKLKVGDPLDETNDMGAIVSKQQFERVVSFIDEGARQPGARTVTGGHPPSDGPLASGYYVEPTVFANVRNDWRIAKEEIFGPVLV